MLNEVFYQTWATPLASLNSQLSDAAGDWLIKGFIDVHRQIYPLSVDTKVISKLIEAMLLPELQRLAQNLDYQLILSQHQNHYPDVSLMAPDKTKFAVDLKSSYRTQADIINGFTLGAFTGYFRERSSSKNTTFPYGDYQSHWVLGFIYSRHEELANQNLVYQLDDVPYIRSAIYDFEVIFQEKWRIASDQPGSGNTKNIGSSRKISELRTGQGVFANLGERAFDDYWMNYLTADMARAIDSDMPYHNLEQYWQWKNREGL
jgi:hypothetical protein